MPLAAWDTVSPPILAEWWSSSALEKGKYGERESDRALALGPRDASLQTSAAEASGTWLSPLDQRSDYRASQSRSRALLAEHPQQKGDVSCVARTKKLKKLKHTPVLGLCRRQTVRQSRGRRRLGSSTAVLDRRRLRLQRRPDLVSNLPTRMADLGVG